MAYYKRDKLKFEPQQNSSREAVPITIEGSGTISISKRELNSEHSAGAGLPTIERCPGTEKRADVTGCEQLPHEDFQHRAEVSQSQAGCIQRLEPLLASTLRPRNKPNYAASRTNHFLSS